MYTVDTRSLQTLLSRLCGETGPVNQNSDPAPLHDDLDSAEYWRALQDGLAFGSFQQKKLCLAILRISILNIDHTIECEGMQFDYSRKAELVERYAKFHSLFVTIVLNRYINQIEDCIHELEPLMHPTSGIDPHWIMSLLAASVDKALQESIRKICGRFLLEHGYQALRRIGPRLFEHLTHRFLPWMAIGSPYNTTIIQVTEILHDGQTILRTRSLHGDRVVYFLEQIIGNHAISGMKLGVVKCILQNLSDSSGRMFSFARAYFLAGTLQGLLLDQSVTLDQDCAALIGKLVSTRGTYHEIASDCMTLMAKALADRVDKSFSIPAHDHLCNSARALLTQGAEDKTMAVTKAARALAANLTPDTQVDPNQDVSPPTIETFLAWVTQSNYQCLRGDLLRQGSRYLQAALDRDGLAQPGQIKAAVEALWEMIEIQDLSRYALIAHAPIIMHHRVLLAAAGSETIREWLEQSLLEMQRLSENRPWLFVPFATALRRAVLYDPSGHVLPLAQIITQFARFPPKTGDEFRMEYIWSQKLAQDAPWRTYESYYGKHESFGYAAFLDMLNSMPNTTPYLDVCRTALDTLLDPWIKQKLPPPVFSYWKSTTQLQVILILAERCITPALAASSPKEIDRYLSVFFELLRVEPLPRFRYLTEWIIARIFVRLGRRNEVLAPLDALDLRNPRYSVSQIKLALMLACLPGQESAFAVDLANILIVLCANPKVAVRHEAQWSIPLLWDFAMEQGWKDGIENNPALRRMDAYIRTMEAYKDPPPARLIDHFNPVKDDTLTNLVSGDYLKFQPGEKPRCIRQDFVDVRSDDADRDGRQELLALGAAKDLRKSPKLADDQEVRPLAGFVGTSSVPLQMKAASWEDEVKHLLGEAGQDAPRRARPFAVVASLIDNDLNVGGLSRVSEIFGCEAMYVRSLNVAKSKSFESVAVSSGTHLPLLEAEAGEDKNYEPLVELVRLKKSEGYTVVGIEQTDDSRILGDTSTILPKKLVLLVGSEREGIPARLLGEMDWCVEVRQLGLTRSMNVQTATAVVLYEYGRQHP